MALVVAVDYPNKRITLGPDSVGVSVNVIDIYTEMRERRRLNADQDRQFFPMIFAQGNEAAGPSNTPRRVVLVQDVRIIPHDATHILRIEPVPLVSIDEGLAGVDLFDRSSLTPANDVDIDYQPVQVEIINQGTSGLTATESTQLQLATDLMQADEVYDQTAGLLHYYRKGTTVDLIPPKTVVGTTAVGDASATE